MQLSTLTALGINSLALVLCRASGRRYAARLGHRERATSSSPSTPTRITKQTNPTGVYVKPAGVP